MKFQHDYCNSGITSEAAPRLINGSCGSAVSTASAPGNGIDTTPVVYGKALYVVASGSSMFAIDKVTGDIKWRQNAD